MNSFFKKIVTTALSNPKKLFLIDGFGALISAFLLGVVLVKFEPLFGIPKSTLYFLAFIPILFLFYDAFCYVKKDKALGFWLKGIAMLNFSYCFLSVSLTVYHLNTMTTLGWIYIFLEVIIVSFLATIQLKTGHQLSTKRNLN